MKPCALTALALALLACTPLAAEGAPSTRLPPPPLLSASLRETSPLSSFFRFQPLRQATSTLLSTSQGKRLQRLNYFNFFTSYKLVTCFAVKRTTLNLFCFSSFFLLGSLR